MVKIETIRGTPEGDVIRTMKIEKDDDLQSLDESVREKGRTIKSLSEIKETILRKSTDKSRKASAKRRKVAIKKGSAAFEKLLSGKKESKSKSKLRLAVMKEKNRQLQIQLDRERQMQANQTAAQQRSFYEQPPESYGGYEESPQQEFGEEAYSPQQKKSSSMSSFFRAIAPNPGAFQRLGQLGGGVSKAKETARTHKVLNQQATLISPNKSNNLLTPQGSKELVREPSTGIRIPPKGKTKTPKLNNNRIKIW